jgi:hypothetical protein
MESLLRTAFTFDVLGRQAKNPGPPRNGTVCLSAVSQNRKAELLDAMRSIMAGEIPRTSKEATSRLDLLREFEEAANARWDARVASLPADAPPKFPHGYYDVGIAIDGNFKSQALGELRHTIETAVKSHSGWPPFLTINRVPLRQSQ